MIHRDGEERCLPVSNYKVPSSKRGKLRRTVEHGPTSEGKRSRGRHHVIDVVQQAFALVDAQRLKGYQHAVQRVQHVGRGNSTNAIEGGAYATTAHWWDDGRLHDVGVLPEHDGDVEQSATL